MLLLDVFTSLQAQTRDVITFSGGHADAKDPNIYVIDVGDVPVNSNTWMRYFPITISRPQGATATQAATIRLREVTGPDCYPTVTFEPGETEKTVNISAPAYSCSYASGNLPAVYNVFQTEHAEAEYQVLIVKMNTPAAEGQELEECTYATQLEVLQNSVTDFGMDRIYRWGEYALFRLEFTTPVKIQADSRYVLQIRETDHTGLALNADDWGQSKTHEVELTPLNAGSVCDHALFLYRPGDDELLNFDHFEGGVYDYTFRNDKCISYHVLEAGPFEVAKPMEGGIRYIFFSRTDMENSKEYQVAESTDAFQPTFSNVSINKTSFKSGETMVITAMMDNWQIVRRARQDDFINSYGVTLDGSETIEPRRTSFDETTGRVTCFVTAPTVSEATNLHVDFGPIATVKEEEIYEDEYGTWSNYYEVTKIIVKPGCSFPVSVSPEPAPEVPATSIDFAGLPADGSTIVVNTTEYGDWVWRSLPLSVSFLPTNATDATEVTYSVEANDGSCSYINDGILYLNTCPGTIKVKATLPSGVSTERTFYLWVSPPEGVYHTNSFMAGTTFTKFEFEIKNDMGGKAKDDKVTVNYTHANGTTWTETYKMSKLKKRKSDSGTMCYEVPFNFTEEHPEPTSDQIGEPVVTAQAVMDWVLGNGKTIPIEATATLVSELKKPSFDDYFCSDAYYNETHPATLTANVMYLPRKGFTVGYMIPNIEEKTYSNLSGEPLPDWLELEEEGDYYYTAHLKIHPNISGSDRYFYYYTMAQRSYIPDEVMERHLNGWVQFYYASAEEHLVFKVNGVPVTGDLTFDNRQSVETFVNKVKNSEGGILWSEHVSWSDSFTMDYMYDRNYHMFGEDASEGRKTFTYSNYIPDIYDEVFDLLNQTNAQFYISERLFEGAEITLTRGDEVVQTLKVKESLWNFMPPSDGQTYTIEVYFPAYDKRYTTTFVSGNLSNIYALHTRLDGPTYNYARSKGDAELLFTDGITDRRIQFWGGKSMDKYHCKIKGFVYAENPKNFYLHDIPEIATIASSRIRLNFDKVLKPLTLNKSVDLNGGDLTWYKRELFSVFHGTLYANSDNALSWNKLNANNTLVTVVNSEGEPVNNATLNFACVDKDMVIAGEAGTTQFDSSLNAYQVSTDPGQHAQLIEVVADGYQTQLSTMYLWNYDYYGWANRGKMRRHTIVLQQKDEALHSLDLETLKRSGNLVNNEMMATINADNLLIKDEGETLDYSQTADYETVVKHVRDAQFGSGGWNGTKYAHLTGMMPYESTPDLTLTTANGSMELQPLMKNIDRSVFTTFSQNYCFFDFDLTDQIADDATVQPVLKNGTSTLATLPSLHNHTIDLMALNEANNISMPFDSPDLANVDNDAKDNGVNTKDMNKAFDKFSFQVPPVLPFTVNIERDGDYFMVRAVCEVNFLPGGPVMDALDKLENYQYFDEQFQACMDAVNTAKPADDDFFDDIPRWPSAFVGIKGYLSGIGYINREKGKFEVNFLEGGLTFEASAAASANVSFGLGSFGMSVDAKIAMSMGLINSAAEMGDVSISSTKIDFVFDYQTRLKVCAWAYAGIDLWIAKAVAGVRGGACIDLHHRAYVVKGQTGMKTTLQARMEAFAEARFLFWKAKKTWPILNVYKEYLTPNNPSNPFHPDNPEPIFSMSRQNVTKSYKKLKRKVIADLGTPIISNVSGMAQPTYLLGGQSLLFDNLKSPGNYNDDRLQVYSDGGKSDLVDTGINAPMYDFAEAHNSNGMELVAFEQVKEELDGDELESMSENDQTKTVSEKSEIHVAMRQNGGAWTTEAVGTYWSDGIGCVAPAVAVQDDGKAVVVWQQGVAKFNEQGTRYIDGSMMLSRFDGSEWGEPIEIKRLNRRSVPADYQVSMKGDDILVMMTLQQDVDNELKQATVVYVTVSADDKVRERYTQVEGSKPQMVTVNGANLVGYLKASENGRDVELSTVNMKGEPTGKLTGNLDMKNRMVNDFRLIVDDEGNDLTDVALLWSQSDQESKDNGDGTTTVNIKNRIYVSKLCSHNKKLYFSTPVEIATMPDDVSLASMDGSLNGLDMKVAYCVTNDEDGGAVLETPVAFTNAIDHKISYNAYEVTNENQVPVTITVVNNGFEPIGSIDVTMGGETYTRNVSLMPQESTELEMFCPITDSFNGTIDYDVAANFIPSNSNSLKVRRAAAARPHRVQQSGTQADVRQVDMGLKVLSKKTDSEGKTTIVAEVNNASLLPLADDVTVKVGLYDSPLATEKFAGTTEVTVSAADLYDATAKQNKVKIVTLTAAQPDIDQVLFLRTTPMRNGQVVNDVRPSNNVLPVRLTGKLLLGDINGDGKVDVSDYIGVANRILGQTPAGFIEKAGDVNGDGQIDVSDYIGIANIILTGSPYAK